MKIIEAGFSKIDDSQQEAALSLGSSEVQAFFSVILPQLKPAISMGIIIGMIKVGYRTCIFSYVEPPWMENNVSLHCVLCRRGLHFTGGCNEEYSLLSLLALERLSQIL